MKKYRLYILDFDGTAFDTLDPLVDIFNAGFESIGRHCTIEDTKIYMQHSLDETCEIANVEGDDIKPFCDNILKALDEETSIEKIKPYLDFMKFIKISAKNGYIIGIVSNNKSDHISRVLSLNKINPSNFNFIVGYSPDRRTKPHPDMLLYALELSGVSRSDACYIGDSLQDVEAASNAGMDGYLIDREDDHISYKGNKIRTLIDMFQ